MTDNKSLFRLLPSVDNLLKDVKISSLLSSWRRDFVVEIISSALDELRKDIKSDLCDKKNLECRIQTLPENIEKMLHDISKPSFSHVINATGVVVHTNLGRSPLPEASLESIRQLAGKYLDLEFDLNNGHRGQRDAGVRKLLSLLFPGFEGIVVNNNAAAVLLALNTLSDGKESIISRGRIIEIGDGFRINQIQEKSGATLVEVGTTNRTHIEDFEQAINKNTALLLSVHPSNYRLVGFTSDVPLSSLTELARKHSLLTVEDWGSGCLVDTAKLGIKGEESLKQILNNQPDAVCFSGDKLLGGPQAGLIIGKPDVIAKMRKNHLYRALRVDKLTLLALEEVLIAYLRGQEGKIPTIRMLKTPIERLKKRALAISTQIDEKWLQIRNVEARVGGGAAPEVPIKSVALEITPVGISPETFKDALRESEPPIIARVADERVYLDLRTVFEDEDDIICIALKNLAAKFSL